MNTRTVLALGFALVAAAAWANGDQEPLTPTQTDDGYNRIEAEGLVFDWQIDGDALEVRLSAPTTGWVSIGFEPTRMMQDANIIIGYVSGSDVVIEDHFGSAPTAHGSDTSLGGTDDVTTLGGSETDGRTEIRFSIPLDSGDEYDKPLSAGTVHTFIYAFGADGDDNTRQRHTTRGGFAAEL